jgi:DNA repair exonuclease SbcCD ATPase subunit
MWSLTKLHVVNLYSHEDTTFTPKHNKLSEILGVNEDDDGADSNGSGKSGLVDGMCLLMLGETYRDTGREEFITNNKLFCKIEGEFFNPVLVRLMHVERVFYRGGKSATGKLIIDNVPIDSVKVNINNLTKELLRQIGINKEDLRNYYIIGQGNRHSFFTAGDTKQKEIISRFSNFDMLDKISEQINGDMVVLEQELQRLELDASSIQGRVNYIQESIEKSANTFEDTKKQKLADKLKEKNKYVEQYNREAKVVKETRAYIIELQKKIKSQPPSKMKELENAARQLHNQMAEFNTRKRKLMIEIEHQRIHLEGAVQCPKCANIFVVGEKLTVEQLREDCEAKIVQLQQLIAEIGKIEGEVMELADQIEIERKNTRLLANWTNDIKERTLTLRSQEKFKLKAKEGYDRCAAEYEALKLLKFSDQAAELENSLRVENQSLNDIEAQIADKRNEINDLNFYSYHFSKSGFKTHLSNKTIRNIEDITNLYLRKFDTNLCVKINGYTVNKDGSVKDKIDIFIVRNGIEQGSFTKFSGGERSRIDICGMKAIQTLINNSCEGGGLNLFVLDEAISYLDRTGLNEVGRILSQMNATVIVVSQYTVHSNAYTVTVRKQNGISKIDKHEKP